MGALFFLYHDILTMYEVVRSASNLQHRRVGSPSVTPLNLLMVAALQTR